MSAQPLRGNGTAIVLGVESQIGLAIIRELGRAGVQVIALTHDKNAIGLSSRYVVHSEVVMPRSESLIQKLRDLGQKFGHCSLITISEANLQWLCRIQEQLGEFIHPALPPQAALAKVLDKQQTLAVAQQLGIAIPLTAEPRSLVDIADLAAKFPFPAVLKWKDAEAIAAKLAAHGLPFIKAEYVYSGDELLASGLRYESIGHWPLVQQYCRGQGLGQFFFMHEGQVLQRFQHLRIAEWPPEGGFSSVCDAIPLDQHVELQDLSIQLLRAIGWQGVAMVEYRFDAISGHAILMEINGRFWGSYPLAMHSNCGFALLAHQLATGQKLSPMTAPLDNLRCRMVGTEIKRLILIIFQPNKIRDRAYLARPVPEIFRFLIDFFRPRVRYFIWDRHDGAPFFRDVLNIAAKFLNRIVA